MKTRFSFNNTCLYLNAFGLHHNPFPVAPDDSCLYLSETIDEIITEIVHGVIARKGFIMLTGEVGLGKTTISRQIISLLTNEQVSTSLVLHTNLQETELLKAINRDFGIVCDGDDGSLGDLMESLNRFLLAKSRNGHNCAIVIDDAQNLSPRSLELVRMISNLECDRQKLVQIILVGQNELDTLMRHPTMRQLYSRIVIRKMVRSLTLEEMRNYMDFKLNMAGNKGQIRISPSAYRKIYRLTRGNFRKINLLMDRCMYALYCNQNHRIDSEIVILAWTDLHPQTLPSSLRRWAAMAASVLIPVVMVCAAWWLHLGTSRELLADPAPASQIYKVPEALAALSQPGPLTGGVDLSSRHAPAKTSILQVAPAVGAFLDIYQLGAYGADFQKALQDGTLESLSRRIYSERGYQLIALESIPDRIRNRYGALAFSLEKHNPPVWLLFWRPKIQLKRFYYRYQGDEIAQLQRLFADLNLYRFEVDGIVGPRLMDTVVAFQAQNGLPVTGFPDARTLFWICHPKEAKAHG